MKIRILSILSLAAALGVSASNSLSGAVQEAKPVVQVAPVYSHDLRASGIEGDVVVGFTITASGAVANPVVVSSTDRELERPALAAVRKWKFEPAMDNGVAVSVKAVQPISFVMPDLHPEAAARLVTLKSAPASQAKHSGSVD
jgi:TonB family protein